MRKRSGVPGAAARSFRKIRGRLKKPAETVKAVFRLYTENDMPVYAGFATLKIAIACFPLFMLIIAILNWLPGYSSVDFSQLLNSLLPDLPSLQVGLVRVLSNLRAQSSGLLASIAALTALWAASAGVFSIQRGLRKMLQGESSGVRGRLTALAFTVAMIVLIPVFLLFNLLGDSVSDLLRETAVQIGLAGLAEQAPGVIRISSILSALAAVPLVLAAYVWLPGGKRPVKSQLPGALFTAAGWALFTWLFAAVIPLFWRSAVYGSLASFFLVLLWLQAAVNILFLGAALNRTLAGRRGGAEDRPADETGPPKDGPAL